MTKQQKGIPKKSHTIILIKPHAVESGLRDSIDLSLRAMGWKAGLSIVLEKTVHATPEMIREHYDADEEWCQSYGEQIIQVLSQHGELPAKTALELGHDFLEALIDSMTSGPLIVLLVEAVNAVDLVKVILRTVRGMYSHDSLEQAAREGRAINNHVACSESPKAFERQFALWFDPSEVPDLL